MKLRIATRESRLALMQTQLAADELKKNHPDWEISLVPMTTTGDRILDRTLDTVGGKGLFIKELERALLEGRADLAVHSLKDVPMEENPRLPLVAFLQREDPRDVLVFPKEKTGEKITGAIGCASSRRRIQLEKLYPECTVQPIRGNVLTRLEKLDQGQYGALVLAAAGLKRLGLEERIGRFFTPQELLPAAGQGILAIQARDDFDRTLLEEIRDKDAELAARAERAFVRELGGGCSSPAAAFCTVEKDFVCLTGLYVCGDGSYWTRMVRGRAEEGEKLGRRLALSMREEEEGREHE